MKPLNMLLGVNGVLLAGLVLIAGPFGSALSAQTWPTEPSLSPCCKTAVEGNQFCCADCCGSGWRCKSACEKKY